MSNDNQQENPISQAREKAEKKIDKIIDNYAAKIPGASQYSGKAKGAVGTILKKLEESGERRLGTLSGLFRGHKKP
ncbi:MAG TPA: hypothetical protein VL485_25480 [Ktedonobacteraceae bacterium]|jgi:hypothetical protein|nr:hypothetical protein [Ktedonobacteraceae bacterium]